jgi:hypothetical protein
MFHLYVKRLQEGGRVEFANATACTPCRKIGAMENHIYFQLSPMRVFKAC